MMPVSDDEERAGRMTVPAASDGTATAPAAGIAELGAEAARARTSYGEGALIACDRLVRIYTAEGIEVQALQGLGLLICEGELTAVVGASGSGKSTLMNILAGLDAPTAGAVRVSSHDLAAMSARARFSGVARRQRAKRASDLLAVLGIAHCADRTPEQLSGGEQQRTAIATALANRPMLLDRKST